jgi:O-glycosyl hydrolase
MRLPRAVLLACVLCALAIALITLGSRAVPADDQSDDVSMTQATVNLTVDGSQEFQTIDGMGANVNVNSWNGGQLKPALDFLVDQNGCSLLRVIRDPMDWVTSESDIAPLHSLDAPTLARIYEAPKMQDIWNTVGYLNQKGLHGSQIMLNFMGWTPPWLGGSGAFGIPSHITPGKEAEFATMVASLLYYGREVRGLDFSLVGPMNEEDWDGKEGPQVGTGQYATVLAALADELDAMGLTDVRIVGPDTVSNTASYITAMMNNSTVRGRVDHLAFHAYGQSTSPGASYSGKDYWLTESAEGCGSPCDQGLPPSQGEWNFARQTNDYFLQDLANGLPAILVWEGYDSFYYHHNSYSTWGLLAYGQMSHTYTRRKRFYVNGQLNAFIRPGATRVRVTGAGGSVIALAFHDGTKGTIAIVGHNTGSSAATINGQLGNGLPSVGSLAVYLTDSGSRNLQRAPDVPVTSQSFSVSVPGDTFFSLANFTVANPAGLSVTSISPVSGSVDGGTSVTIAGNGFEAGATASIGGVAATGVVVSGSTSLTAVTGPHETGLANVTVTIPGPQSATLPQAFFYAPPPAGVSYYTVPPCRAVDTRQAAQAPALAPFERRVWTLAGRCGVPGGANAVALNVTVTGPTAAGHVRLAPGNGLTDSSTLNFVPGQTRANNAVILLATDATGGIAATNRSSGSVHVILDVNGYFQ